jgi:hypothetical protein
MHLVGLVTDFVRSVSCAALELSPRLDDLDRLLDAVGASHLTT